MPMWKGRDVEFVNVAIGKNNWEIVKKIATVAQRPADEIVEILCNAGLEYFADNRDMNLAQLDLVVQRDRVMKKWSR